MVCINQEPLLRRKSILQEGSRVLKNIMQKFQCFCGDDLVGVLAKRGLSRKAFLFQPLCLEISLKCPHLISGLGA